MLNVLDRLGFTRKRVSIVEKFQKPLNQAQFVSVKTSAKPKQSNHYPVCDVELRQLRVISRASLHVWRDR